MVTGLERLATGAERARYQICQAGMTDGALIERAGLVPILANARNASQRVMVRPGILAIGSERAHFHQCHSQSAALARADAHKRMTAPERKVSETADPPQLRGVKVAHKAHKMAQDHQDENFKSDQSLSEPLPQLSKTANGVQRCDPILQLPNRLFHLVKEANLLLPQL